MLIDFLPEARPRHTTLYVHVRLYITSHMNIGDMQLYLVGFLQNVHSSVCVTGYNCILTCTFPDAALHHAAEGGHLDVVAKLVIAGCNVSRYDSQGTSPGHLAARHGYHQVMDKLLLAGFGLDMQGGLTALHGSVGSTALHIAAQHGHQQVCQYPVGSHSTAYGTTSAWLCGQHCPAHCCSAWMSTFRKLSGNFWCSGSLFGMPM